VFSLEALLARRPRFPRAAAARGHRSLSQ